MKIECPSGVFLMIPKNFKKKKKQSAAPDLTK